MSYQYAVAECGHYLRIEVYGAREKNNVPQESLSMWESVAKYCQSKHINLILAVFHLEGTRSLTDTFNIVAGVQQWIWPELAIAYVDTNSINVKTNIIAEQSAMLHGINFRTFLNEKDAIEWLQAMYTTRY